MIAAGAFREATTLLDQAFSTTAGRYCVGLVGRPAEAEELVQEALLAAYNAMPRYRATSTVRAWYFGIVRRVCGAHLRRRDRRRGLAAVFLRPPELVDPPDLGHAEDIAALQAALGRLKPMHREAVLMQYQVGLTGAEVAQALNITPAAARKRVSLAIASLRADLSPVLSIATPHAKENRHESKPVQPGVGPRIVRS